MIHIECPVLTSHYGHNIFMVEGTDRTGMIVPIHAAIITRKNMRLTGNYSSRGPALSSVVRRLKQLRRLGCRW